MVIQSPSSVKASAAENKPIEAGEINRLAVKHFNLCQPVVSRLVNISENITYKIEETPSGRSFALRIHRDGYHSKVAIASEIDWLRALRASAVALTPVPVCGRDGEFVQVFTSSEFQRPRHAVLFEWENGQERAADANLKGPYEMLGQIAAQMHIHSRTWRRPSWFTRHAWNFETTIGSKPHWGRWCDGMGVDHSLYSVFSRTAALIDARLKSYGRKEERFGLIHADLRLANLLFDEDRIKVIDFDDCGFGWFMYDAATAVSFFEHAPIVPELIAAWTKGYKSVSGLTREDETEIPTFIMLRRLLLVAWIGSHAQTDLAQAMGHDYTRATVPLCQNYLRNFG